MATIDKLYFGVVRMNSKGELEEENLFDLGGVKWDIANYIVLRDKGEKVENPFFRCFIGVWRRCEYEMMVSEWPPRNGKAKKVDLYKLYVLPNKDYLMSLVDKVSVSSAKKYLREWRKNRYGK